MRWCLLLIICCLVTSFELLAVRTRVEVTRNDHCLPNYNPQCLSVITNFKRVLGVNEHIQQDTKTRPILPWRERETLAIHSQYTRFFDRANVVPTLDIFGRSCAQVDLLEISYGIGNESFREIQRPSLSVEFTDSACTVGQVSVRPLEGTSRVLTRELCLDQSIDLRLYGVIIFDACKILFNVDVPTRAIDYTTPLINPDCSDCIFTPDGDVATRLARSLFLERSAFETQQRIKRESGASRLVLERFRQAIVAGKSLSDIRDAFSELKKLLPLREALELLLSVPSLRPSDKVLSVYAEYLAWIYSDKQQDNFGNVYPEQAYLDRRRVFEAFQALARDPNLNKMVASHVLHQGLTIIGANKDTASYEFDRLIGDLTNVAKKVESSGLDNMYSSPIVFITSSINSIFRDRDTLNAGQRGELLVMLNEMYPRVTPFDQRFLQEPMRTIMLDNFIDDSSEDNLTRITSSPVFSSGAFNGREALDQTPLLRGLMNSSDPAVVERTRRLVQYLGITL